MSVYIKKIFFIFILMGVAFFMLPFLNASVPDLTQEEQSWLADHDGKIRIVHTPDWPPMDFLDENGNPTGMAADYVHLIEKKLKFKFKVVPVRSWSEMLDRAKSGTIDVISAGQETDSRKDFMTWSTPFLDLKNTIIVRKALKGKLTLDQMTGMQIGVARQYVIGEYIRKKYPHLTMIDVANPLEGIQKVSFGELDAMITEVPNALYIIETERITNLRLAGDTGFELKHGMGIRKDWPIFARIIEKTLMSITEQEHKKIYSRWVQLETHSFYRTKTFWYSVLGAAAVILIVIGSILLWNMELKKQVHQRTEALRFNEIGLEALLTLNEQPHKSIQDIIEFAFRQMQELTQSRFGYLTFEDQDGATYILNSSGSESGKIFYIEDPTTGFSDDTKGLWRDAVRLGRPVISNDYAMSNPGSKGLPAYEPHLIRYMNVPIFNDEKIVVVVGMGNKDTDYTHSDLRQLSLLAHGMWRLLQRKKAELAMQKTEKRFHDLMENSPNGMAIVQENMIVYKNSKQIELMGDLNLMNPDIDPRFHQDDLQNVKAFIEQIFKNHLKQSEVIFRLFPDKTADSHKTMTWVSCIATPIDYNDRNAFLFIFIDMTEKKKLQHLLTIQDKMASLGHVSAGIAHEIRNPLSGINIYLDTIDKFFRDPEKFDKTVSSIQAIRSASHKIELVIRRVMNFAKPTEPKFDLININEPIKEAIKLTRFTLNKKGIEVIQELDDGLPGCYAEFHLIEEVLLNLINNATDAILQIKSSGIIKVSSRILKDKIMLCVEDSGPGIERDLKGKIFDPFFTTKNYSTGIGLSLCHRVVTDHKGEFTLGKSDLGGASFVIALPLNRISSL